MTILQVFKTGYFADCTKKWTKIAPCNQKTCTVHTSITIIRTHTADNGKTLILDFFQCTNRNVIDTFAINIFLIEGVKYTLTNKTLFFMSSSFSSKKILCTTDQHNKPSYRQINSDFSLQITRDLTQSGWVISRLNCKALPNGVSV